MMGVVTNVPTRAVRTVFFATPMGLDYLSMLERNNLGGEGFATFCQCHRFGMLPTQFKHATIVLTWLNTSRQLSGSTSKAARCLHQQAVRCLHQQAARCLHQQAV